MSTTTATTTTSSATRVGTLSVLSDYELHHSGQVNTSQSSESTASSTQPANWPTDHRRVPAYRPVNRGQNLSERAAGANAAEFVFIQTMLHGCWLNAVASRIWHATGGKINDKIFHYEIGGEW